MCSSNSERKVRCGAAETGEGIARFLQNQLCQWKDLKFHHCKQRHNETVGELLDALKHMSERCKFVAFLDEALKDRFLCGWKSEAMEKNE